MNLTDLHEILVGAEVDPTYYAIQTERHDALCILPRGQTWLVFVSEKGNRHQLKEFASEDEACTFFLKRIFQLWRRDSC